MNVILRSMLGLFLVLWTTLAPGQNRSSGSVLRINDLGYYSAHGVDIMVFDDFYPEGHQGGVTIVQRGVRIAANGDVRLEPTPGQWSPVPKLGGKHLQREEGIITAELWYPDSSKDRKGFNPIEYPDLLLRYSVRTEALGSGIRLSVDLDRPLPAAWDHRVGFNLELFPGTLFGEYYLMDGNPGTFPRHMSGPMSTEEPGWILPAPLARGRQLVIAPGDPDKKLMIRGEAGDLLLYDGRGQHNNGWFIVRSTIPAGATKGAVTWTLLPSFEETWRYPPVIQVSQVGYHPSQSKVAVIELDLRTTTFERIQLVKIGQDSATTIRTVPSPASWGRFLRYRYLRFDFSDITDEGLYRIRYGAKESVPFEIRKNIFSRQVWQPTLEYFLPVQMCHMAVIDRYRVWHGLCHMDDARMAPVDHLHFDGYRQGSTTLSDYRPGERVPGLNVGGWHDAGDFDLRIESQAETVYGLALAEELFREGYDNTSVDQGAHTVRLHVPDGKADIVQQLEHGVLTIIAGYRALHRPYRGIICPTLQQYVHLGDPSTSTDNIPYVPAGRDPVLHRPLPPDDGWVFTEEQPRHELLAAQALAAASGPLRPLNPVLADSCLIIAQDLYTRNAAQPPEERIDAAAELFLATSASSYAQMVLEHRDVLARDPTRHACILGRFSAKIGRPDFTGVITSAIREVLARVQAEQGRNPYHVQYAPDIWGAGWGIQAAGVRYLLLHLGFPDDFPPDPAIDALTFVLGLHPGDNTSSFVSGVGSQSLTVAYGYNRDDWSHIPGGVASGTALIRPDLPELKVWPYFWQQSEYVIGGGTVDFLLLALAADRLLNR